MLSCDYCESFKGSFFFQLEKKFKESNDKYSIIGNNAQNSLQLRWHSLKSEPQTREPETWDPRTLRPRTLGAVTLGLWDPGTRDPATQDPRTGTLGYETLTPRTLEIGLLELQIARILRANLRILRAGS